MSKDAIGQQFPWLDAWFERPRKDLLRLNESESEILDELSARWTSSDKLELLDALRGRYGNAAEEVVDKVLAVHFRLDWQGVGRAQATRTMDDLMRVLWEPLGAQGFELTIERQPGAIQIRCTRCPHAELAKKLGAADWLYHLACYGDPYMTEGFNPRIGFRRTKTLMQGHECCDHFYYERD